MTNVELHATRCAICETEGNSTELYPANFEPDSFTPEVFSARRLPDRIHYRLVKCNHCGLVRSDPMADPMIIERLYHQSSFDYGREVEGLAHTYGTYLERLEGYGVNKGSILEIGCGNGFFLNEARRRGWLRVQGVEPSQAAVNQAYPEVRAGITCTVMKPGLFPPDSFDAICLFQVLDHILDPGSLISVCFKILKPGGFILCLNHNVESVSARLLKERSPIIDIEHSYLYSPATIASVFQRHGFVTRTVGWATNRYSIAYLTRLLPMSGLLKQRVLAALDVTRLGRKSLRLPLGNLYAILQKPRQV